MALIECKECGQMVSDKAEICPNCGCPVEKEVVCEECGEHFKEGEPTCPKCGCPVSGENATSSSFRKESSDSQTEEVKTFMLQNKKFLPIEAMKKIQLRLMALDEEQFERVRWVSFKEPGTMLLISIFLGLFGVDRFMLGHTELGIFKLILTLCCGIGFIWWLYDIFHIEEMTLDYNYELLSDIINRV